MFMNGVIDLGRLSRAFMTGMRCHEIFRTAFHVAGIDSEFDIRSPVAGKPASCYERTRYFRLYQRTFSFGRYNRS